MGSINRLSSKKPEQYYDDGNKFFNLGRYAEAVASYDKALAIDPNNTSAKKNRENTIRKIT